MHVVTKGQKALYEEDVDTKKIIATFHQRRLLPWSVAVLFDWLIIIGLISASIFTKNLFFSAISCIFIAGRQHALMVLMHEGAHGNIVKDKKLNLLLSNVCCAWPTFLSTEAYALNHIEHHKLTNRSDDPDMRRKAGKKEWLFPKTLGDLLVEALEFAILVGPKEQFKMARHVGVLNLRDIFSKIEIGILLILIAMTGHIVHIAAIWLMAYFFILPTLFRIRSLGEHFGLSDKNYLSSTRNTYASSIEKALISPHKINLHLTHHLYPGTPFYNLEKLDALLGERQPEYSKEGAFSKCYISKDQSSVLGQLTSPSLKRVTQE